MSCCWSARSATASRGRATAASRCWSAVAWASRRWPSGRTSSGRGLRPCSASGTAPTPTGAALLHDPTVATDDGSVGHHGLVTDLLEDELDERGEELEVYACGPPAMLEAVRAMCVERGVPAQLALESGMACGFGACFGCVVPTVDGYVRLCLEGPVIEAGPRDMAEHRSGLLDSRSEDVRPGARRSRAVSRERGIDGRVLRDRAGPPDHQRARARSTRSPPGGRSARS